MAAVSGSRVREGGRKGGGKTRMLKLSDGQSTDCLFCPALV